MYVTDNVSNTLCFLYAAGAPCSSPEYWCHISPNNYAQIEIGEEGPAKVVCTIPYSNGYDIRIINHFGQDVRRDPALRNYVKQVMNPLSNPIQHTHNKSFHLEIYRPKEKHLQEKLSVIQCIGILRYTSYPCRTSLINIQFTEEAGMQNCLITVIKLAITYNIIYNAIFSIYLLVAIEYIIITMRIPCL